MPGVIVKHRISIMRFKPKNSGQTARRIARISEKLWPLCRLEPPLVTVLLSTGSPRMRSASRLSPRQAASEPQTDRIPDRMGRKQGCRVTGTSCRSLLRLDRITGPARGPFCDCEEAPVGVRISWVRAVKNIEHT